MGGASNEQVLTWAANDGRVLLSHDASTMTAAAYARLERDEHMPGLIVIPQLLPIGVAIDDLALIAQCSTPDEWDGQVRFPPLS